MKKLLAATTLTLIANLAVAGDYYGNFASQELETTVGNNQGRGSAVIVPSTVQVSLYSFDLRDAPALPDSSAGVNRASPEWAQSTAYDQFLRGDPDASPGTRTGSAPMSHQATHQAIATRAPGEAGGA